MARDKRFVSVADSPPSPPRTRFASWVEFHSTGTRARQTMTTSTLHQGSQSQLDLQSGQSPCMSLSNCAAD